MHNDSIRQRIIVSIVLRDIKCFSVYEIKMSYKNMKKNLFLNLKKKYFNLKVLYLLFLHSIIEHLLNICSYIHFSKLLIVLVRINPVGKEYINELVYRVDPNISACETRMTIAAFRSIFTAWTIIVVRCSLFVVRKDTPLSPLSRGELDDRCSLF